MTSPSLRALRLCRKRGPRPRRARRIAACFAGIAFVAGGAAAAPPPTVHDDLVVFHDENRMVGEVRGLERGKLSFKTDSTGTIAIEWQDVQSLVSTQRFEVTTAGGDRYFGSLVESQTLDTIVVDTAEGRRDFEIADVVGLAEIERTLLEGINGDLNVGYQYTNASDITQLTLGWDVSFRREDRIAQANFDANSSSSSDNESSQRINLDTQLTFVRPERWFWSALLSFETNDELGLDLRSSVGGGRGRILRQSNNNVFMLLGGLVLTKEDLQVASTERDTTVEGVVAANFQWFRFDTPELDVSTRVSLFPNLSDSGRFRTSLDVDFRWEVFRDLFLGFAIYHTHNSDPPAESTQNDYGVTTSVGWKF